MDAETRRDRWMVARHRANAARINAANWVLSHRDIRGAIDELDSYLRLPGIRPGRGWWGDPLVFPVHRA